MNLKLNRMSFIKKIGLVCFIVFCCAGCRSAGEKPVESAAAPRIINIINFIRQTDYRVENADSLLYETVCEQVKLVNKYDLPATFLLQYDALINPLYQDLLKSKLNDHSEIGAWWELTQPQIEAAGIKWRGEHSWVSRTRISLSAPDIRKKNGSDWWMSIWRSSRRYSARTRNRSALGLSTRIPWAICTINIRSWRRATARTKSGDGWLYPMGWLLEPSLLPEPGKRLYAGADRGGANPRSYFPYAGQ